MHDNSNCCVQYKGSEPISISIFKSNQSVCPLTRFFQQKASSQNNKKLEVKKGGVRKGIPGSSHRIIFVLYFQE